MFRLAVVLVLFLVGFSTSFQNHGSVYVTVLLGESVTSFKVNV